MAGISTLSGFNYNGGQYNFARDGFKTLQEMFDFPERYMPPMHLALNEEDNNLWLFSANNPEIEPSKKWRIFKGGTDEIQALLEDYVKKEDGKSLSTNDYTTLEKEKLAGLESYDDKAVKQDIAQNKADIAGLEVKVDELESDVADASTLANSVQSQLDSLILNNSGSSDVAPEVIQARTDLDGTTHTTLKTRLDADQTALKTDILSVQDGVRGLETRMITLDGIINPQMEVGGISLADGSLTYATNTKKIRTKEGIVYRVKKGATVGLTDYTAARLHIYRSVDGLTFLPNSVLSDVYTFAEDSYVALALEFDDVQTDTTGKSYLIFKENDSVLKDVSEIETTLNGKIKNILNIAFENEYGWKTTRTTAEKENVSILQTAAIPVNVGEKYHVFATGTNNFRPWVTTDTNYNIIRLSDEIACDTDVTIQEGEYYLICNASNSKEIDLYSYNIANDYYKTKEATKENTDTIFKTLTTNFVSGIGWKTIKDIVEQITIADVESVKIGIVPNSIYHIKAYGSTNYMPWCTTDSKGKIIRIATETVVDTDIVFSDNEMYLYVNNLPKYDKAECNYNLPSVLSAEISARNNVKSDITGGNLCPILPQQTKTSSGVTYVSNGDGTYTANGTAESSSYFVLFANTTSLPTGFKVGKTYFLEHYSVDKGVKVQIRWVDANGEYHYLVDKYCDAYFTIPEDAVGLQIRFSVGIGRTVDNFVFKPVIYDINSIAYTNRDKTKQRRPILSIIYDDGHTDFLTYIVPLIQSKKIPIATAVVPDFVDDAMSGFMSWEQIDQCFLQGAEVLTHADAKSEEEWNNLGVTSIQQLYLISRNKLKYHGYNPSNAFVFSGGSSNHTVCRKAARNIFEAGFNASTGGINFYGEIDPYYINRYGSDNQTLDTLKSWIDELVTANTGWMIWTRHNSNATTENQVEATQILSDAIDYALEHGIDIVTVERGLAEYL